MSIQPLTHSKFTAKASVVTNEHTVCFWFSVPVRLHRAAKWVKGRPEFKNELKGSKTKIKIFQIIVEKIVQDTNK